MIVSRKELSYRMRAVWCAIAFVFFSSRHVPEEDSFAILLGAAFCYGLYCSFRAAWVADKEAHPPTSGRTDEPVTRRSGAP